MKVIQKHSKLILLCILTFAAVSRLLNLEIPKTYYFDEVYHAYTAKAYARNDPRGYEWWNAGDEEGTAFEWLHPPISKLFIAGSIKIFGENSFAWRLPSALMGVLVIYAIYLLAKELFQDEMVALLAALFGSLDGLLLVQSRIAMNDIYLIAFMLFSCIFYWRYRSLYLKNISSNKTIIYLFLTSVFVGLSVSTKWTGAFLLPIIGFIEGLGLRQGKQKILSKQRLLFIFSLVIIPSVIYLLSYAQFFLQGHTTDQFIELHNQIFRYQFNLDATHPYQSRAWEWPLLLKNVWYHVDYSQTGKVGNIFARSNPLISWGGLIAVLWMIVDILKKIKKIPLENIFLITAYFVMWLPWVFSPRIMFYYHYAPAIPFLVIILSKAILSFKSKIIRKRMMVTTSLLIVVVFFIQLPHWVGFPVSKEYSDLLFWLPSWR